MFKKTLNKKPKYLKMGGGSEIPKDLCMWLLYKYIYNLQMVI